MRIKINFSKNNTPIHIDDSIDVLNSYINKCLGRLNQYHDNFSNYSISSMQGGKLNIITKFLNFNDGMYIIISTPDDNTKFINDIIYGIMKNPHFGYGMNFISFVPIDVDTFTTTKKGHPEFDYVQTISPILLKEKNGRKRLTFKNCDNFEEELTLRSVEKLKKYDENINLKNFKIEINNFKNNNKVKKYVSHNNDSKKRYENDCNMIRLKITGNNRTRKILYELGIGSSTGSGFGSVIVINKLNIS